MVLFLASRVAWLETEQSPFASLLQEKKKQPTKAAYNYLQLHSVISTTREAMSALSHLPLQFSPYGDNKAVFAPVNPFPSL